MPDEIVEPSQGNVRAVYAGNRLIGFQDPDQVVRREVEGGSILIRNQFLQREVAVKRLTYDFEEGAIRDSFGTQVGVAGLRLPASGAVTARRIVEIRYTQFNQNPYNFRAAEDEQLVERLVMVNRDGSLRVVEISYGLGQKYDPTRTGSRWRAQASEAMGLPTGARASTNELRQAVASREFVRMRLVPTGAE